VQVLLRTEVQEVLREAAHMSLPPPRSCSGCMAPPLPQRHPLEATGRDGNRIALCVVCLAAVEAAKEEPNE